MDDPKKILASGNRMGKISFMSAYLEHVQVLERAVVLWKDSCADQQVLIGRLEQENAKLKERVLLLEKVREAAGYLPENPVNADRDILDCIIVEIIHAIKKFEEGNS